MEEKRKNKLFDLCRLCLVKRGFCDITDRNELCDNIHKFTGLKVYFRKVTLLYIPIKCYLSLQYILKMHLSISDIRVGQIASENLQKLFRHSK